MKIMARPAQCRVKRPLKRRGLIATQMPDNAPIYDPSYTFQISMKETSKSCRISTFEIMQFSCEVYRLVERTLGHSMIFIKHKFKSSCRYNEHQNVHQSGRLLLGIMAAVLAKRVVVAAFTSSYISLTAYLVPFLCRCQKTTPLIC